MVASVVAAAVVAAVLLLPGGDCQCYSTTTCTAGSRMPEPTTQRECCVGTDEGLAWSEGGTCTICVVHGFTDVEIRRDEGQISSGEFRFFVKGEAPGRDAADILLGTISDDPDTALAVSDYTFDDVNVDLEDGVVDSVTWRLTLMDDSIALEYDDALDLEYTSSLDGFGAFEAATPPQFIRTSIRIHIVDTDDLGINYNRREYDTDENTEEFPGLILSFRETQEDFTIEFIPATVNESIDVYSLSDFLDLERFADETQRATADDDFNTTTFNETVSAGDRTLELMPIPIRDDDVNENEQVFVLVTRILGQAADTACFQVVTGDPCSSIGGAVLRIRDDDPMLIGFSARRTSVRENQFSDQSRFPVFLNIIANRRSELDYVVTISEGQSSAEVTASAELTGDWDFAFGFRDPMTGLIFSENTLFRSNTELAQTTTFINNDIIAEDTEEVTLVVSLRTIQDVRENPMCLTDPMNPMNYFCAHTVTIIDEDEPLEVSFERTLYSVNETDGQVEICVILTKPDTDIFENVVGVEVYEHDDIKTNEHIPSGAAIADGEPPDVDYDRQRFGRNQLRRLRITEENRRICYNQTVVDDLRLEPTEYAGLTLEVRDSVTTIRTEVAINHTAFQILDNDVAVVGLEPVLYRVDEDVGAVEICAVVREPDIDCPIEFDFNVTFETADGVAEHPGDYVTISTPLSFARCETRSCINVTIVDDNIPEAIEDFTAHLRRSPGLDPRITLDPITAIVEIIDEDPIVVGYEMTVYTTTEGEGSVELCAIVTSPSSGGAPRAFTIEATTSDGTAVSGTDYEAVMDEELAFDVGDTRMCHTINILNDDECEKDPNENFFSDLSYVNGTQPIEINPDRAEVIINDIGEPECENITVGYEMTIYTTTEGQGMVELCAVVTSPSGGAPRPFTISATTRDGTAVAGEDYVAVDGEELVFNRSDTRVCHTIEIINDDICESDPNEFFFSDLAYVSGEPIIIIDPPTAEVVIDDSAEPECNITVGYERTVYTTTEGQGMVELCAVVTSHPGGSPRDFTISATTRDGTAVAGDDYVAVAGEELVFSRGDTRVCHTIDIINDDICESDPNENFFSDLAYVSGVQPITISPPTAEVIIDDTAEPECGITVGYERTVYTTTEGEGMVVLCAVVTSHPGGSPRTFTISATTRDGTAVAGEDYEAVDGEELVFNRDDTRVCHTIRIINDSICESDPNENFFSDLAYVSGMQPIRIDPPTAEVIIDDTGEPECIITVGYEMTVYTTTEGQGMVELCAVVTSHPGGAPRAFTISATTRDGTAIAGEDYVAVAGEELVFDRGDMRMCHTITILQDTICEDDRIENFFSDLAYVSGMQPIIISPQTAEVIIDDSAEPECNVVVGYEMTVYTTTEGQRRVELCAVIFNPPGGAPEMFTISATTRDGSAIAGVDYVAVVNESLVFSAGDVRECHNIGILQDDRCENNPNEDFFSDLMYVSGLQPRIDPPTARVIIDDSGEPECVVVLVNDTLTGDPLMTVPLLTEAVPQQDDVHTSLCYEVHGEADKFFSLISDECTAVNAHYAKAPIAAPNLDLNVVDAIGVRAVGNDSMCRNISVGLSDCQATVNGMDISNTYRSGGITVREYNGRVRISVPNCEDRHLVMWVFCLNGTTEDPVTWEFFHFRMIRFVVTRGLNLNERSHGIIGQFWNVPIDVEEHTGNFSGSPRDDDYIVTVNYPGSDPRSFVGLLSTVTWEFEKRPCIYVGNSQAGPIVEVETPNDSIIEGEYTEYEVESMFATDFKYTHFNEDRC